MDHSGIVADSSGQNTRPDVPDLAETVIKLLATGADVDAASEVGETALM